LKYCTKQLYSHYLNFFSFFNFFLYILSRIIYISSFDRNTRRRVFFSQSVDFYQREMKKSITGIYTKYPDDYHAFWKISICSYDSCYLLCTMSVFSFFSLLWKQDLLSSVWKWGFGEFSFFWLEFISMGFPAWYSGRYKYRVQHGHRFNIVVVIVLQVSLGSLTISYADFTEDILFI